jgi:hypothetical protein
MGVVSAYHGIEPAIADRLVEVSPMADVLADLLVAAWTRGRVEGRRDDIVSLLGARFGVVPEAIRQCIDRIDDPERLMDLVVATATVPTLHAFDQALRGQDG